MQVMPCIPLFARKAFPLCIVGYLSLPSGKLPTKVRLRLSNLWLSSPSHLAAVPGVNFTAYQEIKKVAIKWQPELTELPSYQHMVIGLISGAMGPFSNAPIDTIKTREFLISPLAYSNGTDYRVTRSTKIARRARKICNPTDCLDCDRHVENRRLAIVLQRHHSACATSGAWTSYRIRGVWTREQDNRDPGCDFNGWPLFWVIVIDCILFVFDFQDSIV